MGNKPLYRVSLALSLAALTGGCTSVTTPKAQNLTTSWTDKVTASVKNGTTKLTAMVTPKSTTVAESEPANRTPGPGVHVAMAQISERNGNLEEAELQYQKALKLDNTHLGALVGYAHLEDSRNNFEAATKLYQKAIKKHPDEASVYNDLGLCYHRRGMLPEATKSLEKAVQVQPARRLYRDNLAAVFVEQGKPSQALAQLTAAHGEAVGHYNLAYLLTQKNDNAGALVHFEKALAKDPSLAPARDWIAQLAPDPASRAIEPLPPTEVLIAERPPQVTDPPAHRAISVASAPRPSAQSVPAAPPRYKEVDGFMRAQVSDSASRFLTKNNSSRSGSDLHFLPSQDANSGGSESSSKDRSTSESPTSSTRS